MITLTSFASERVEARASWVRKEEEERQQKKSSEFSGSAQSKGRKRIPQAWT